MALRDLTVVELQGELAQAIAAHTQAAKRRRAVVEEIGRRDKVAKLRLKIDSLTPEERALLKEML